PAKSGASLLLGQVRPAPWILGVFRREPDGGRVNFWRDRRPAGQSHKEGERQCVGGVQPA
ncbi:hypothetical protein Q6324_28125, partial [Klebsiella pneumoniae]|uniref:hypothetical protein n=1 Tax=Klebsiella pneumoniae TaxID=573 RepID=UPI00273068D8